MRVKKSQFPYSNSKLNFGAESSHGEECVEEIAKSGRVKKSRIEN